MRILFVIQSVGSATSGFTQAQGITLFTQWVSEHEAPISVRCRSEWGSNGDDSDKRFVCNNGEWGYLGRNHVSPLEMGMTGGVGVSGDRQFASETGTAGEGQTRPGAKGLKLNF